MENLSRLEVRRAAGTEPFTRGGEPAGFDLLSFWQWASSDLVVNIVRGLLAEYLVAQALGIAGDVRDPWQPYDLRTPRGLTLEVKSCSYLQSWWQKKHSTIGFMIPETTAWSADTGKFEGPKQRQAQAYVFAVLRHLDKATLNPRELDQWEFYLVPTHIINQRCGAKKQLSLKALLDLDPVRAVYSDLRLAVRRLEDEILGAPG